MSPEHWLSPVLETRANVKSSRASRRMLGAAAACPGLINLIDSPELLKQNGVWAGAPCLLVVSTWSGSDRAGSRAFLRFAPYLICALKSQTSPIPHLCQNTTRRCWAAFAHLSLINVKPSFMNHS